MITQESYVPTHPDLFIVEFLPGDFTSRLVSLKVCFLRYDSARRLTYPPPQPFEPEETIAYVSRYTKVPHASYTTVQCGSGPEDNIELNSDLAYGEWIGR